MTRLIIHMTKGDPHVVDFPDETAAKAALDEVMAALARNDGRTPVTIAGRLVLKPEDVRSAELASPPTFVG